MMETGRGYLSPPNLTATVEYNQSLERCGLTWDYAQDSKSSQSEIGMFLVSSVIKDKKRITSQILKLIFHHVLKWCKS